jgi:hypothetical protein
VTTFSVPASGSYSFVNYNGSQWYMVASNSADQLINVLPVVNGGTGVTASTGSGNTVLSTSPALTTPSFSSIVNTGTLTLPTSTDTLVARATTDTLTNKRITKRVSTTSSGTSPTIAVNADNYDVVHVYGVSGTVTISNPTGTPADGDTLRYSFTASSTGLTLSWGGNFESSTAILPTTTVSTTRLDVGFFWNTETSKWRCVAVA